MKKLLLTIALNIFCISLIYAESVDVEFNSTKAVLNEQVTALVRIETDAEIEPKLALTPVNADIIQQDFQGLSTSTTYSNGNLSTRREYVFAVTIQPKSIGRSGLTNISVDIGGRILRHDAVWIDVSNEKEQLPLVFVLAQPSKTRVYQNEPILLRYYLMYQVDLASVDIKEFPKLNNFIKRYLQEQGAKERVIYEGSQYIRQLLYSVVIFPEKAKNLKIDAMKVQVAYDADGNRDPFGFGGGRIVSRLFTSKPIDIEVVNLPGPDLPTGFTGLVGKHKFSLSINKNKVLTNEPIEMKLKVTGNGNLEGLEAPEIIKDASFETFDTNSNLEVVDSNNATKTFDYTYLPRKETKIPPHRIPLSFFNPETKQFETVEVDFPGLEVVGGVYQPTSSNSMTTTDSVVKTQNKEIPKPAKIIELPQYAGAIFDNEEETLSIASIINFALYLMILILVAWNIYNNRDDLPWVKKSYYLNLYKNIETSGLSYAAIEELLLSYPKVDVNIPLKSKINQLDLPAKTKSNLLVLVDKLNDNYAKSTKAVSAKDEWRNYKEDLKKLTLALDNWDKNKSSSKEL